MGWRAAFEKKWFQWVEWDLSWGRVRCLCCGVVFVVDPIYHEGVDEYGWLHCPICG